MKKYLRNMALLLISSALFAACQVTPPPTVIIPDTTKVLSTQQTSLETVQGSSLRVRNLLRLGRCGRQCADCYRP